MKLKEGGKRYCDSVVVATGGLSYPKTGCTGDGYRFARSNGHTLVPTKPALVPLEVYESWVKELQGLSLKNIAIEIVDEEQNIIYEDFGEMLFTHFGVSGPIILSGSPCIDDLDKQAHSYNRFKASPSNGTAR